MECPKCPKYERCVEPEKCIRLNAELNRATFGRSGAGRKARRKEIHLIYEHQLSRIDRLALENALYAGGEMPEERV